MNFTGKKKRTKRTPKKDMKKVIKTTINSMAETYHTSTDPIFYPFADDNTVMSDPVDLTECIRSIQSGDGDGQRSGTSINVVKSTLKMVMKAGTSPCILQIFIGRLKNDPAGTPSAADLTNIFDDGIQNKPADGRYPSLLRAINRDKFNILYYKKYKLGTSTSSAPYSNNDFPLFRLINLDLKTLKGKVRFSNINDPNNNNINRDLFMWCNYVDVNDASPVLVENAPKLTYWVDLRYKDF